MYKITSKLQKSKRIVIVTDKNIYSLYLNMTLSWKLPLAKVKRITIIKNSSAMFVIHP